MYHKQKIFSIAASYYLFLIQGSLQGLWFKGSYLEFFVS